MYQNVYKQDSICLKLRKNYVFKGSVTLRMGYKSWEPNDVKRRRNITNDVDKGEK